MNLLFNSCLFFIGTPRNCTVLFNRIRESVPNDEGSVSSHAVAVGIGALAIGVGLFAFRGCSVVEVTPKTEITIDATVVGDEITLPADLNIVSIAGGSSSAAEIGIDVGIGVGGLSRDVSIGSIPFTSAVVGETVITYGVLKDGKDNKAELDASNIDKYISLSVEEDDKGVAKLIINADVAGFSANAVNIQSGPSVVQSEGLISFFRSVPPEIAGNIATGAQAWNSENFRLSCAKDITNQKGILEAGLAKAIAVQIQLINPVILQVLSEKYPDHPEVTKQALEYIQQLSDPANMEVRFVADPNNPNADHAPQDKKLISYMLSPNMSGEAMANNIGLDSQYIQSISLNTSSSTCNLTAEAKQDIQDILKQWRDATPYDDAMIDKLEAKE